MNGRLIGILDAGEPDVGAGAWGHLWLVVIALRLCCPRCLTLAEVMLAIRMWNMGPSCPGAIDHEDGVTSSSRCPRCGEEILVVASDVDAPFMAAIVCQVEEREQARRAARRPV